MMSGTPGARARGAPGPRPVLRMCASFRELPQAECVIPERCVERACSVCMTPVHYDPKASLPFLGPERLLCEICADDVLRELS